MSEVYSHSSDVLMLADPIARRMAHKWAQRKGLSSEVAETVLDDALPILWSQRIPPAFSNDEVARELMAKAIALVSVQKGRKIQYDAAVLERTALAWWAALRAPRSQFVGDDGSTWDRSPESSHVDDTAQRTARLLVNRALGYCPLWELSSYHAG